VEERRGGLPLPAIRWGCTRRLRREGRWERCRRNPSGVSAGSTRLVNNAGVAVFAPLLEHPTTTGSALLEGQLTGPFLCTKAAAP